MHLITPLYSLKEFPEVYEPSEDTFLFLDALELEIAFIQNLKPTMVVEVGSGSGVVINALAVLLNTSCAYFATDVNPQACCASLNTSCLNNCPVDCLNMNLLSNFKEQLFDIVLFNPPYVVTDSNELSGTGLSRAWAGGYNGREIIDILLQNLKYLLSKAGVCYMVILKENRPEEIKSIMLKYGFESIIIKERKIRGEHLFVLKFYRVLS